MCEISKIPVQSIVHRVLVPDRLSGLAIFSCYFYFLTLVARGLFVYLK